MGGLEYLTPPESWSPELWLFGGFMLSMAVYHTVIYLNTRDRNYRFLVLFILGFLLFEHALLSTSDPAVRPSGIWGTDAGVPFFISLTTAALVQFSRSFLRTRSLSRVLDRILLGDAVLAVLIMSASLALGKGPAMQAVLALVIITAPLLAWAGYLSLDRRRREAAFFLASLGVLSAGILVYQATAHGMLTEAFITVRSREISAGFLTVVLSLGLVDRINTLRKDLAFFRKQIIETNRRLEEERELVLVTLRCVAEGVIITDTMGRVFLMNELAEEITGYPVERAMGRYIREVLNPVSCTGDMPDLIRRVLKHRGDIDISREDIMILKDGSTLCNISCRCSPIRGTDREVIGIIIAFSDVTRQRRYEDEIIRSSKMSTLSTIAGGIAHDFNNILTAILGNVSLAKLKNRDDGMVGGILADIESASFRARGLTQQLLTFSKGGAPVKAVSDIRGMLVEVVNFHLVGSSVKVEMDIEDGLWNACIDLAQMSHVVGNIVINAKQAMPSGGRVWVTALNYEVDSGVKMCVPQGRYLRISIRDEGHGIPQEDLGKIFDPFYTTKPEGNGLGLASSFSVVKNHDGGIEVFSKPGEGSEFIIYLPATQEMPQETAVHDAKVVRGSGKILLMDDEYTILKSTGGLINALGYDVVCVRNGFEAVNAYRHAMTIGMPFDLVITDLVIPGSMGGRDTALRLQEIDPEARVVVMTGCADDPVLSDHLSYGFRDVIIKPFTMRTLSQVIASALEIRVTP